MFDKIKIIIEENPGPLPCPKDYSKCKAYLYECGICHINSQYCLDNRKEMEEKKKVREREVI